MVTSQLNCIKWHTSTLKQRQKIVLTNDALLRFPIIVPIRGKTTFFMYFRRILAKVSFSTVHFPTLVHLLLLLQEYLLRLILNHKFFLFSPPYLFFLSLRKIWYHLDFASMLTSYVCIGCNRQLSRWRHFTSTTRIHFILLSYLNLSIPLRYK